MKRHRAYPEAGNERQPLGQLPCPHCAATNRLPAARIAEAPDCGSCGKTLLSGQPLALDGDSFDAVVAASAIVKLVQHG